MSKKTKLWVGIFIVGGVLLFCVGLFLIGSREQVFAHHFQIYTEMADMQTLQTGASVDVDGMNAGQVTGIKIPDKPSDKFRLTLQVDDKFHRIIREDSVASIETSGMVGSKFVNISHGSDKSPEAPPNSTIPSKESSGMAELMQQGNKIAQEVESTITDVHSKVDQTLESFTKTANHVDGMIVASRPNIEQTTANVNQLTADARDMAAGIKKGQGAAGKLITDPSVASDVQATIANAKDTSANAQDASKKADAMITEIQKQDVGAIHQTVKNVDDMTGQLNQAVGSFLAKGTNNEPTSVALRNTVQQSQHAVTNLTDDTEAIKHNFFLRGFFRRRGFFSMHELTPEKYAATKFVKKPAARVWVPAEGLFTAGSDGQLELTAAGRNTVDQSMSDLVPFLPNNPVVVEGYATEGLPDQRYTESRQRAEAVREYIQSHYHLRSEMVGIMPLRSEPPPGTGKTTWDGVCLTLVASKR